MDIQMAHFPQMFPMSQDIPRKSTSPTSPRHTLTKVITIIGNTFSVSETFLNKILQKKVLCMIFLWIDENM